MNWQESVLSDEQLDEIGYPLLPIGDRTNSQRVAKSQAKVSYKAGAKDMMKLLTEAEVLCTKEFAEKENCATCKTFYAKLKKAGIE